MVITKTPLRVSFCGGGSDIEYFYSKYGGAVLSSAINKYIYVIINKKFSKGYRVSYNLMENVQDIDEIKHPIVRNVLEHLGIEDDLEISTISDIPSSGSGLGSSSSFTVGLMNALYSYRELNFDKYELAEKSCFIEIEKCREPIGKQDQYAAAFGGLNFIVFNPSGEVRVEKLKLEESVLKTLQENLIFFYTGISRSASKVLADQKMNSYSEKNEKNLVRMVELAYELKGDLEKNNIDNFGNILHEGWMLKKSLGSLISNENIDEWYEMAINAGAIGGKILGAGAGGFLMFYCPKERQDKLLEKLNFLRRVDFKFESQGSIATVI